MAGTRRLRRRLALRDSDPGFFAATIGIHPHESADAPEGDFEYVERLASDPRIVGIGETGLDYHYDHSPRDVQQVAFRRHIGWSRSSQKPVVVHVREAHDDCARILREEKAAPGGIIHCFTGGPQEARTYLELGFFISFSGVVTFKNAAPVREAARLVPLDRISSRRTVPSSLPFPTAASGTSLDMWALWPRPWRRCAAKRRRLLPKRRPPTRFGHSGCSPTSP